MAPETTTYFISYAREDTVFATRLAQDLREAGARVWIDQLDIPMGERWDMAIEKALKSSSGLILVLSPDSVGSHNVLDEVSFALEENKRILPVMHKPCELPFRIRRLQYVDMTGDYDKGLKRMKRDLKLSTPPPKPQSEKTRDPEEEQAWQEVGRIDMIYAYQRFLKQFPDGNKSKDARDLEGIRAKAWKRDH